MKKSRAVNQGFGLGFPPSPFPAIYTPPYRGVISRGRKYHKKIKKSIKKSYSEDVCKIVSRLKSVQWPKGSANQLEEVTAISLRRYKKFLHKLSNFLDGNKPTLENKTGLLSQSSKGRAPANQKLKRFGAQVRCVIGAPVSFVERWWWSVRDRLEGWESWNGSLRGFIFHERSFMLETIGQEIATNYCSDIKRWEALMEAINED